MKKIFTAAVLLTAITFFACAKATRKTKAPGNDSSCGTLNGKTLHKDNQRNCYYLNESGLKEYVENSACACM